MWRRQICWWCLKFRCRWNFQLGSRRVGRGGGGGGTGLLLWVARWHILACQDLPPGAWPATRTLPGPATRCWTCHLDFARTCHQVLMPPFKLTISYKPLKLLPLQSLWLVCFRDSWSSIVSGIGRSLPSGPYPSSHGAVGTGAVLEAVSCHAKLKASVTGSLLRYQAPISKPFGCLGWLRATQVSCSRSTKSCMDQPRYICIHVTFAQGCWWPGQHRTRTKTRTWQEGPLPFSWWN